jgi:KDO2-lipid IV(A) lauroyltransferase
MVGFIVRIFSFFIQILPYSLCRILARGIAFLCFSVLKLRRKVVEENLITVFGSQDSAAERYQIAKKTYQHYALMIFEFIRMAKQDEAEINRLLKINGIETFQRLMKEGKGLVFTSGHLGNWEIALAALSYQGYECYAFSRPLHDKSVDAWVNDIRAAHNIQMIHTKYSIRPVLEALQRNAVIGFLIDQDAGKRGTYIPFLGKNASTFQGPAYCAYKAGSPILPAYILRGKEPGSYEAFMQDPIYPDTSKPEEEEILRLTIETNKSLEAFIRQNPEQYFWFHKRWRNQPLAK